MQNDTPQDAAGARLCEWCGGPIVQPVTGRRRAYCRRSCRQRAYEGRRQREAIVAAVASALVRSRSESTRDETPPDLSPSRDETPPPAVAPPMPPVPPRPAAPPAPAAPPSERSWRPPWASGWSRG
ncbi:hypothetical protein GT036_33135 [Streptomyces sp. SID4915]|nr:hypothetical protein [Streptomyces sp. SID4915]